MSPNLPKKPPVGLPPRHIAEMNYCLERSVAITEATYRYTMAGLDAPPAWAIEYSFLQRKYMSLEKANVLRKKNPRDFR